MTSVGTPEATSWSTFGIRVKCVPATATPLGSAAVRFDDRIHQSGGFLGKRKWFRRFSFTSLRCVLYCVLLLGASRTTVATRAALWPYPDLLVPSPLPRSGWHSQLVLVVLRRVQALGCVGSGLR